MVYNKENNTWNAVSGEQSFELVKMNEDGTATLSLQNGTSMTVTPDAQGIATARIAIGNSLFFCSKITNTTSFKHKEKELSMQTTSFLS